MTLSRKSTWSNADGLDVGFGARVPERYATAEYEVDGSSKQLVYDFTYKNGASATMDVPAGFFVTGMLFVTGDLWNGGTAIEIGDGTDPNGWFTTTLLAEATLDDADNQSFAADGAYALKAADTGGSGKLYAVADTIDIAVTGTFTSGTARLIAFGHYVKISNAEAQ